MTDLPVEILGRTRSDRVMRRPTPPRVYDPKGGRPPKHGDEFIGSSETWGAGSAVGLEYQVDGRDPVAWRDEARTGTRQ
nr:transposase [Streptomyces sp. TSRI0281]